MGSHSVPPPLPFVWAGGGGGTAGASASGSEVARFSVYIISFRLYFFSDNLSAFSSVNYHYSIHNIIH